jgi:prepilin-type N-terminal cleavage/methylation domain-containing protein
MTKRRNAFSLIELSIVILIIGILVAGVTQGSKLVRKMSISTAQSLTKSSPVNSIKDIVGWWETTLNDSFGGEQPEEDQNGGAGGVTTWHDLNPQSSTKNNATSASTTNNPGYTQDSKTTINGLPTLEFDGTNQYLRFDGTSLANSNYSIFIVEQRNTGTGNQRYIIGSTNSSSAANQLLHVGYRDDTNFSWRQYSNDYNISVAGFSSPISRIHAMVFDSAATSPKIHFINGSQQTLIGISNPATLDDSQGLTSYTNAAFGFYSPAPNTYYKGNVGEIIIFNRALKTEERRSIEEYLAKKWKIEISN